jgi:hypothetical protein
LVPHRRSCFRRANIVPCRVDAAARFGMVGSSSFACSDPGPAGSGETTPPDASSPDGGTPVQPIGLACTSDSPCLDTLVCLGSAGHTLSEPVPPGGYCTKACTADTDCGADTACVPFDPTNADSLFCAPTCTLGDSAACGNRADVACWSRDVIDGQSGRVCLPTCNNSDQCPSGTVCDGVTNLCSKTAQGGGTNLGTPCDPAAANTCADGMCMDLGAPYGGVCTAYCRRGTFPQCNSTIDTGVCGWVATDSEAAGPADIGLCAQKCRCDADCSLSTLHCVAHPDLAGTAYPGLCSAVTDSSDTDCSQ